LNTWEALLLGLVEGITEYLPISSTGHLILTSALLGLDEPAETRAAVNAFVIIIQGGAILAVLGLYRQRVAQMLRGLVGQDAAGRRLALNLLISFLPAAVLGVLLDDLIEQYLFYAGPVIAALFIGGIAMLAIGPWQRRVFHAERAEAPVDASADAPADAPTFTDLEHLSWHRALVIGLLQCVAMWPGTSRSMMTIVGGMVVGLRPRQAAEYSFLLGLPTLGGACVYRTAQLIGSDTDPLALLGGWQPVLVGVIAATVSAALAVKWLVAYLTRHGLALFGWYRVVLAAVFALLLWQGSIAIAPN
jgi:undecaprenyl-diphosphatase